MHSCAHLRENAHKGVSEGHIVRFTRRNSSPDCQVFYMEQLSSVKLDKKGWKRASDLKEAVVMYTPIGL
jgi:hypothetical protein